MPYLRETNRRTILEARCDSPQSGAELNFVICKLADAWFTQKGLTYDNINEFFGAVECAKLEITRRIVAPYEDKKIAENSDVFTCVPGQWTGGSQVSP